MDVFNDSQCIIAYSGMFQGIVSNVTLAGRLLTVWSLYRLNISKISELLEHGDLWQNWYILLLSYLSLLLSLLLFCLLYTSDAADE